MPRSPEAWSVGQPMRTSWVTKCKRWDVSQVTDMSELFRGQGSVQRGYLGVGYLAGHEHGDMFMAPPRSTKTSDRGIPRRSRTWGHVLWRRRVQPRHRIVEYRAGHEHGVHVQKRRRVQPRYRIVEYRAGHDMMGMFMAPPRSTKTSDRGIPRRSRPWRHVHGATAFNQDIGSWNTAQVTDMESMFSGASAFNQDIGSWNTAQVTNMAYMFYSTAAFNQDIGSWNTAQVTTMQAMFSGAAFNQAIGSWDTSKVTSMRRLFEDASAFNQDIGSWNTAQVTNMWFMFYNAAAFNQDIGSWNTAQVTNMMGMFRYATAFNYDITGWTTTSLTTSGDMFSSATAWLAGFGRLDETDSIAGPPDAWTALDPCNAGGPIANGAPGPGCTSSLASGLSCTPTCHSGYTCLALGLAAPVHSRTRQCARRRATRLVPSPTAASTTAPPPWRAARRAPATCDSGYTLTGTRSCSAGTLTDTSSLSTASSRRDRKTMRRRQRRKPRRPATPCSTASRTRS